MEQMTIGFDSYEHSTTFLKTRGQLYYEKNKEQVLDYQRTRDRDRRRKREKNYREKDRRRARARLIVFKAIKSGTLKKGPCENCNSLNVQAHHDDYDKPLEVKWFCRRHHTDYHIQLRREKKTVGGNS
jgi:hypothetical protein